MTRSNRCHHERVYACRAETDEAVTAFFLVCASCSKVRVHSQMFLGLFHEWVSQKGWKHYPNGARFVVLAGPTETQANRENAVIADIEQLAAKDAST